MFELLVVFREEGHPPHLLVRRRLGGGVQPTHELVAVGPHARTDRAQRHHTCACQRREVEHGGDTLEVLLRVREGIGEHKAPLGVCVVDMHCQAFVRLDDVVRVLRVFSNGILSKRHHAKNIDLNATQAATRQPPVSARVHHIGEWCAAVLCY
jgi:hypothetical protein